ncbi:tetratricopeptide repeat protein [Actinoplanes sp. NPDC000266]
MRRAVTIALAAIALLAVGAIFGLRGTPAPPAPAALVHVDRLAQTVTQAQQKLRTLPRDYRTWAELGLAYVEQARVSADPSRYPMAEAALRRSLSVRPKENPQALIGLGALANARHDFTAARSFARDALKINTFSADAYGVLADAETQLGRPAEATAAIQRMLDLRPGLAAYARASYDLEQRGRLAEATDLMRRALDAAVDPADIAFCRTHLGDLAWSQGDLDTATAEYAAGLAAAPTYQPLLRGRARVAAATGELDEAAAGLRVIATRTPTPDTLMEYAEVLRLAGHPGEAARQLTLAQAAHRIFVANGGRDDLTAAQLALASNDPRRAVTAAQSEWRHRPFAEVADVLAQSLHAAGRDKEALPYATRATIASPHNASYAYHKALVSLALGDRATALAELRRTRSLNPYFSPVDGPNATRALSALEAQR